MDSIKVDAKGLDCPFPLVKFKKAYDQAEPGQMVEIVFTCAETTENLPVFCQNHGIEIVSFDREKGYWRITARKAE